VTVLDDRRADCLPDRGLAMMPKGGNKREMWGNTSRSSQKVQSNPLVVPVIVAPARASERIPWEGKKVEKN